MLKKGFTLVEVALFLALSGALVLIVIGGTARSIAEKRYNDTVDNFANYLEGLYADANYVSHNGGGNSNQAIYGKMVLMTTTNNGTKFETVSIVADADFDSTIDMDAKTAIQKLSPSFLCTSLETGDCDIETYIPSWGGKIEVDNDTSQIIIFILRSPKTNRFSTYRLKPTTKRDNIKDFITTEKITSNDEIYTGLLDKADSQEINFCVDSDDRWAGSPEVRRLVRIHGGANNASGVEIISNEKTKEGGLCEI